MSRFFLINSFYDQHLLNSNLENRNVRKVFKSLVKTGNLLKLIAALSMTSGIMYRNHK